MDFGDIFFFIVFIVIIVSNVYKQMKKTRQKSTGGETPDKKPGWKTALELVLEEARKQMENQAKQGSAGAPNSGPTGWEGILPKSAPDVNPSEGPAQPEKITLEKTRPEKALEARRQSTDSRETVSDPRVFDAACMRCGKPMKSIKDQGSDRQSGVVFCEACGEQHGYQVVHGDMKLSRAVVSSKPALRSREKSLRTSEKTSDTVKERAVKPEPAAVEKKDYYAVAADKKASQKLSPEALRNAVVWAEILAPPVGLRNM